jgi:hypothetical protein
MTAILAVIGAIAIGATVLGRFVFLRIGRLLQRRFAFSEQFVSEIAIGLPLGLFILATALVLGLLLD